MTESPKGRDIPRERIARLLDIALPTVGVAIVLAAVVLGGGGWGPIWMAVVGLLLVEAGVWRLGSRVMYERRYTPLRTEVQRFVGLARELNHASVRAREAGSPAGRQALEESVAALQESLDRMVTVAGKTEADLEAERDAASARAVVSVEARL